VVVGDARSSQKKREGVSKMNLSASGLMKTGGKLGGRDKGVTKADEGGSISFASGDWRNVGGESIRRKSRRGRSHPS